MLDQAKTANRRLNNKAAEAQATNELRFGYHQVAPTPNPLIWQNPRHRNGQQGTLPADRRAQGIYEGTGAQTGQIQWAVHAQTCNNS